MRFIPWFIILSGDFHGNLKTLNQELEVLVRYGSWINLNNFHENQFSLSLIWYYIDTYLTLSGGLNLIRNIMMHDFQLVCIKMPFV